MFERFRKRWVWLVDRWPHLEIKRNPWGRNESDMVFRMFGFMPYYRMQIIDYTRMGIWSRLRVFNWVVFEVHPDMSGLPGRSRDKYLSTREQRAALMHEFLFGERFSGALK